jgi:catechol 2,3-dioxygenase-like lactoylglutathione lyase family enzyme
VPTKISQARLATLIPIREMSRAIRFYTKTLGGKLTYRGEGEMKDFWASLRLGTNEIWLIRPQKREKRTLAYSTFLVKNIRSVVSELKRKGVRFQPAERMSPETKLEGPIAFEPFGASAFFRDPEGNVLMIWQDPPSP